MEEFIRLSHIYTETNGMQSLKDLNMSVYEGELLLLMGIHGCRKHDIISLILGNMQCTSGEIWIDGKKRTGYDEKMARQLGILCLKGEKMMSLAMTVEDNLFGVRGERNPFSLYKKRLAKQQTNILSDHAGIERAGGKSAFQLSLFEEHLLSIERAVMQKVKLIILDLVTVGYTYAQRIKMCEVCDKLRKKGISVLVVVENVSEFSELADRIIFIRNGHVRKLAFQGELTQSEQILCMTGTTIGLRREKKLRKEEENHALMSVFFPNGETVSVNKGHVVGIFDFQRVSVLTGEQYYKSFEKKNNMRIEFLGKDVREIREKKRSDNSIVFIPENSSNKLMANLSVTDNLVGPIYKKVSDRLGRVNRRMVQHLSKNFFELIGEEAVDNVSYLNSSVRKMLTIYRWILVKPEIIFLENPFFSIDITYYDTFIRLLDELHDCGISIVCSAADATALFYICDKVLCCNDARFCALLDCDNGEIYHKELTKMINIR